MANEVPKGVLTLKRRTRKLYLSWWVTHYSVGLLGVVAGALLTAVSSVPDNMGAAGGFAHGTLAVLKEYSWLLGIIAAVCTSLVTFLGPIHKAERYWSAYHLLDQACLEFEQGELKMRGFVRRVKQARTILQASEPADRSESDLSEA